MMSLIIPPIIVVVSLGLLIYFLSRKREAVQQSAIENPGDLAEEKRKIKYVKLSHFFLGVTEKVLRRIKLLSLQFHNLFDRFTHAVRSSRERHREKIEAVEDRDGKDRFAPEGEGQAAEPEAKKPSVAVKQPEVKGDIRVIRRKPDTVKPMVSQQVTQPEPKKKQKSEMEEALIERIAANPRDIEAYERLGEHYIEAKNYADSLECFKQVVKLSPINYRAKLRIRKLQRLTEKE